MKRLIVAILCFLSVSAYSQKAINHWAFGYKGLISFNTGSPVYIGGSVLVSSEGTATMSDEDGNLLFYTDGDKVYDKNHNLIANGSGLGSPYTNAAQSSIIVKKPGSTSLYYIFTTAPVEAVEEHFYYNVLDMSANGGKGEVIEKKQIIIADNSTEKLAAVSHTNGVDMWILTQKHGDGGEMVAVLLTKSGVETPVLSAANHVPGYKGFQGGMTIARNGIDVVMCYEQDSIADHYKFNRLTGEFTYQQRLFDKSDGFRTYIPAFSADSKKLYVGARFSVGLYQLDMNAADVPASKFKLTPLDTIADLRYSAPLLGPDDKIYVAGFNGSFDTGYYSSGNWLGIISKPEVKGDGCEFKVRGLFVDRANTTASMSYSPVYLPANNNFTMGLDSIFCISDTIKAKINGLDSFSTYSFEWEVGGTPVAIDSSVLDYTINTPGTYTIYCKVCDDYTNECVELDSFIIVRGKPSISVNDKKVCEGEQALFTINSSLFTNYSWVPSGNSVADSNYLLEGTYIIKATNICGDVFDTFDVVEIPPITIEVDDESYCDDREVIVNLRNYQGLGVKVYWPQYGDSSYYKEFTDTETKTYQLQYEFCNQIKTTEFTVSRHQGNIYIPEAFTPNQKNSVENEIFKPYGIINADSYKMEIFSRWGEKLFVTSDLENGWDGNYNGKPAEQGTYLYIIEARDCTGKLTSIKGVVTLIR